MPNYNSTSIEIMQENRDARETVDEFIEIESTSLEPFMDQIRERMAQLITPSLPPLPADIPVMDPVKSPSLSPGGLVIVNDLNVQDGLASLTAIQQRMSTNMEYRRNPLITAPSTRKMDRIKFIIDNLERGLDNTVPGTLDVIKKSMITIDDAMKIHDVADLDIVQFLYAPIDDDVASGNLMVIKISRDELVLHAVKDGKVELAGYDETITPLLEEIARSVSFLSIIAGFLVTGKYGYEFVLVDCLNYNGESLIDKPYEERLHRVGDIASLLCSDNFHVLSMKSSWKARTFIDWSMKKGSPFFIIDPRHVHGTGKDLLVVARFTEKEGDNPGKVVWNDRKITIEPVVNVKVDDIVTGPDGSAHARSNGMAGKRVCSTGRIDGLTKDGLSKILEARGAIFQSRIARSTDLLIIGTNPNRGIVMQANELNVKIIHKDELIAMLHED